MDSSYSDYLKQEYQQFLELIKKNIDLERWGFMQTYSNGTKDSLPFIVIYDSKQCRVKFEYDKPDYGGVSHEFREVEIWYGRLHTKSDSRNTYKENKATKYWYSIYYDYILKFLDGMSSEEVMYTTKDQSPILQEFKSKRLDQLRLHNKIWEHYGNRFFDLFDIQNPELWEKYVNYCNEVKRFLYENRKRQDKIEKLSNPHHYFVADEFL